MAPPTERSPVHVLVAAHDFYPDPGSGGTGRYVYETSRRLVDREHRVSVLTRRRGDVPRTETVDGIDVYRYEIPVAGESPPTIASQLPEPVSTVDDHVDEATADRRVGVLSPQGPLTSLLVDSSVADDVPRVLTFHSPWPTEYDIEARNDVRLRGGDSTPNSESWSRAGSSDPPTAPSSSASSWATDWRTRTAVATPRPRTDVGRRGETRSRRYCTSPPTPLTPSLMNTAYIHPKPIPAVTALPL